MQKIYLVILLFTQPVLAAEFTDCGNSEQAQLLAKLITSDKEQKRATLRCNSLLTQAAHEKAKRMAEFGIVAHSLGGSPNSHLENLGYKLPKHYGVEFNSNQVEAIAGGYSNAEDVWQALKDSDAHRSHLLGEHEFYLEQDEIGVAFIKKWDSPFVEYWVVYVSKGYTKNQFYTGDVDKIPNKAINILNKTTQ